MRILGLDPGLATVGFAILDIQDESKNLLEFGVITTHKDLPKAERLKEIHQDLSDIVRDYKPDLASVEQLFFSKNVSTGIAVAEARGVILLALQEAGCQIHEYSPSSMKRALTGNGKADKKAIQKLVMLELKLSELPRPDDAADAVSLALALAAELRYHKLS